MTQYKREYLSINKGSHWAIWGDVYSSSTSFEDVGVIQLPEGMVMARRYAYDDRAATILEVMLSHNMYHQRTWKQVYSRRHCITLARRMLKELMTRTEQSSPLSSSPLSY